MDLSNWGPAGTPETVADWFRRFSAAGVDHFICRFGALYQFGQVERFAASAARSRPGGPRAERPGCMTEEPRTEAQMRESAELVVDTCFEVTDGDVVTIITDDRRKPEAEMVAAVVAERGGLPIVANNETQIRRALADTLFPMVPPRNLHQAMVTSDQIIIMTNLEWANRFAHVPAVKESVANRARIGSIEEGFGRWPISVADIEQTIGNAKKAIARLEGKKRVRVTSPAGTDVVVSIERRPALEVVPVSSRAR